MRFPRRREEKYLRFIRTFKCAVCGDNSSVEAAHVRKADPSIGKFNSGIGQKPDDCFVVPLCSRCHRRQHEIGETNFWGHMDAVKLALALHAATWDIERVEHVLNASMNFMAGPTPPAAAQ